MRNFQLIATNIDVVPVLNSLANHPELWDANNLRTTYPNSPHKEASDILIFFNDLSQVQENIINDKEVIPYPAWTVIPQLRPIVFNFMRRVEAVSLGRVMLTRLAPGKCIYAHEDQGAPASYYSRYHIMIQNSPGSSFTCGDESVYMAPGECWYFNNQLLHSVTNNSKDDRITMIIDVRLA